MRKNSKNLHKRPQSSEEKNKLRFCRLSPTTTTARNKTSTCRKHRVGRARTKKKKETTMQFLDKYEESNRPSTNNPTKHQKCKNGSLGVWQEVKDAHERRSTVQT